MSPNVDQSLARAQRWLKENTKRFAFNKLNLEIVETGVCTECGACAASCPVNAITGIRTTQKYVPTLTGECISCGICYTMCPRTYVLWSDLIGPFRSVWKARSKLEGPKQDGGAVTALLSYMLDKHLVDAAVVAGFGDTPWLPEARIVTEADQVRQSGGTIYTHAPVVQGLISAFRAGHVAVAVVGTSCNIDAIAKMQTHPAGLLQLDTKASVFTISLFCTESFDYKRLRDFLESHKVRLEDVRRMAISKGVFRIETPTESKEWPIGDLEAAAADSCSYCRDFTGKSADLSCGNVGSEEGWTTVIVRSVRGEHVLQEAVAEGVVEAELLDAKDLRKIETVSRTKAMRYYALQREH